MSLSLDPLDTDYIVVSIRGSRVYYMTMSGKVVKTIKPKRWILQQEEHSCFRLCGHVLRAQKRSVHIACLRTVCCFEVERGRLEKGVGGGRGEGIVVHQPHRNNVVPQVTVASRDRLLKTFSA
jgi:hypothetical protein